MEENLVFGIDLGIASCGWAVLKMPDSSGHDAGKGEILAAGSWCFDAPEEDKTRTPKNQTRRTFRLQRRTIRRRQQRMDAIRKLFYEHGLLPSALSDVLHRPNYDPWELRAKGLDKPLKPLEFALALAHIAKHRGFKSNAKNPGVTEDKEEKGMLEALQATREHLKKYRTFGEMLDRDPDYQKRKRNRDGIYDRTPLRDDLAHEARLIFAKQRELGQVYATEELEKAFMDKAFSQRPMQDSEALLGNCRFEPEEKRTAKLAPSFELFRLLSKLNTLRLTDNALTDRQERRLTPEEIALILPHLGKKTARLLVKTAKQIMQIPEGWSFTQFPTAEDEKLDIAARKGESMAGMALFRKIFGETLWHELQTIPEVLDRVAHNLSFFETQEKIEAKIREQGLKPAIEEALLQALDEGKFLKFKGAGHISAKAARKLIPALKQGKHYDEACTEAGYNHSASRSDGKQLLTKEDFKSAMDDVREEIANPIARKAFSEGMKQLWAMRQNWGLPGEIRIEIARDVGNSAKKRAEIERDIKQTNAQRDKEYQEICKELKKKEVSGETLLRYRLWKEQNSRCLYTDTYIALQDLVAGTNKVQVDHILPWSRFGDDGFRNKTLCFAEANQEKKNRTPYEWMEGDPQRWQKFVECVQQCSSMKSSKKRLFLLQNAKEREEGFRERNLNDTRYAARLFAQAASLLYPEAERGKVEGSRRRVGVRPGKVTALLRRAWGLNKLKKDEETGERLPDDRHHALDAMVVAATTEGELQRLTKACKKAEEMGSARLFGEMSEPWEGFREDVRAQFEKILVARPERRRARGKLHDATIRSVRQRPGGEGEVTKVYERKAIADLKQDDLKRVKDVGRNQAMIKALHDWIERGKPGEEDRLPRLPAGHIIRKVRLVSKDKPGFKLFTGLKQPYSEKGEQVGRPASVGRLSMVRVDIFSKKRTSGKNAGKPEWFLVPVYSYELTSSLPPMRAVAVGKEERDWPIMTEVYRFHFSLYPMSFVELIKSDGEVIQGYYNKLDRAGCKLDVSLAKSKQIVSRGNGAKTLLSIKKYAVDRFGHKSEIKEEVREWRGAAYISQIPQS